MGEIVRFRTATPSLKAQALSSQRLDGHSWRSIGHRDEKSPGEVNVRPIVTSVGSHFAPHIAGTDHEGGNHGDRLPPLSAQAAQFAINIPDLS